MNGFLRPGLRQGSVRCKRSGLGGAGLVRALLVFFLAPAFVAGVFVSFVSEAAARPPPCATDPYLVPDPAWPLTPEEKALCFGGMDSPDRKLPTGPTVRLAVGASWLPKSGPSALFGPMLGAEGVWPSGFSVGLHWGMNWGSLEDVGSRKVWLADFAVQRYTAGVAWEWKYFFGGPVLSYSTRTMTEPEELKGVPYGDNSAGHRIIAPGLQGGFLLPFYGKPADNQGFNGMTVGVKLWGSAAFSIPTDYGVRVNRQVVWSMEGISQYVETQVSLGFYVQGSMTRDVGL